MGLYLELSPLGLHNILEMQHLLMVSTSSWVIVGCFGTLNKLDTAVQWTFIILPLAGTSPLS